MDKRGFFAKKDILIIAGLLAAAAAVWFFGGFSAVPSQGNVAVISINSREVMRLNLSQYEQRTYISLEDEYGVPVNFELENGLIRFADVDCPDKLCEQNGFIGHTADRSAVCLPNRTAVTIFTPEEASALAR